MCDDARFKKKHEVVVYECFLILGRQIFFPRFDSGTGSHFYVKKIEPLFPVLCFCFGYATCSSFGTFLSDDP